MTTRGSIASYLEVTEAANDALFDVAADDQIFKTGNMGNASLLRLTDCGPPLSRHTVDAA